MTIELRPIARDEYLAFNRVTNFAFGEQEPPEHAEEYLPLFEFDRSLAAIVDGQIAGTGILLSFELTVPGGAGIPAGGVSWIGVLPTHRRRGILNAIMRRQLQDVRERGEPLAMLWASESIIYGRYGYGSATTPATLEIDPRRAAFARAPETGGSLRFASPEEAAQILPGVYDAYRRQQPGALNRSEAYWKLTLRDEERDRDGASARFCVLHQADVGGIDGYVTYRVKDKWETGFANNLIRVGELVTTNTAAYADLWRFLLSLDLAGCVRARGGTDEPLRWMLADPRRLETKQVSDGLWLRIVDIPTALAARRYRLADELVLAVTDPFCPENDGCYRLTGGHDGAECHPVATDADIALQIADLSAVYLGGIRFDTLARAGRVEERTPGALRRADLLFGAEITPACISGF